MMIAISSINPRSFVRWCRNFRKQGFEVNFKKIFGIFGEFNLHNKHFLPLRG